MTMETLLEKFSLDGLQKKAAIFDTKKLEWMNGQHLSTRPLDEVLPHIYKAFERLGVATKEQLLERDEWFRGLVELLRVRARTVDDIALQSTPYFDEQISYDPDAVSKQWRDASASAEILSATRERLGALPAWEVTSMETALRMLAEELGVSGGKIFQPLRVALTGLTVSIGIFDVLLYLGRDRSLARLDAAVQWLTQDNAV
jgi:glutamyl-tRNA synthetase